MALLLTIIGRVVDGLPLAASMPSDEEVSPLTVKPCFLIEILFVSSVKLDISNSLTFFLYYSINELIQSSFIIETE